MVAKLENICFGRKIFVREAKMFLTGGKKHVAVSDQQDLFPQQMFPARLNWETFTSATTVPCLVVHIYFNS